MALTSIINLIESLANQASGQGKNVPAPTNSEGALAPGQLATPIQDSFTPSTLSNSGQSAAVEAGLFHVRLFPLIESFGPAQQSPVTSPAVQSAAVGLPAAATGPGFGSSASASLQGTAAGTSQPVPDVNTQNQIQEFNRALVSLGLNHTDILKLDQIATLVNTFSATAFTDLIGQFQVLAQQSVQKAPANSAVSSSTNGGTFQLQEALLQFRRPQTLASTNAAQIGKQANGQNPTATLQFERAQITLTNGTSQTLNIFAPRNNGEISTNPKP